MIHTRHAAAAIASGLCETVLITHGESGRSGVGRTRNVVGRGPRGPVRAALWADGAAHFVHGAGPALHEDYGLSDETLAMVSVVQREWAAQNPRATFRTPITVEDV